jgi:hypothetical protein
VEVREQVDRIIKVVLVAKDFISSMASLDPVGETEFCRAPMHDASFKQGINIGTHGYLSLTGNS